MDPGFPKSCGPISQTIFLVDSDHGHDLKICRSLTRIIGVVGSISIVKMSKRQSRIVSSTYTAELSALRTVA